VGKSETCRASNGIAGCVIGMAQPLLFNLPAGRDQLLDVAAGCRNAGLVDCDRVLRCEDQGIASPKAHLQPKLHFETSGNSL
jgi:hypothetical protein